MVLSDDFYYQPIRLDTINTRVFADLIAKEGDANGRGLLVTLTENGLVKNTTGIALNLKWEHPAVGNQGLDNFEVVDLSKGLYKITYPTEMLNRGKVRAFIQIIDSGKLAGTRNIEITVDRGVGDDTAIASSDSFTALAQALIDVNNLESTYAPELLSVKQQLEQAEATLQGIDRTFGDTTFATLIDLQTTYPTGDTKRYIVAADGKWYWWNGTAWVAGQVAQAIGISNGSVTPIMTSWFDYLVSKNRLDTSKITTGYYMSNGGSAGAGSYGYTDYIKVSEGDVITGITVAKDSGTVTQSSFRFVAAYNGSKAVIGAAGASAAVTSYTVPAGIEWIILSSSDYTVNSLNAKYVQVEITSDGISTGYEPFFEDKYEIPDTYLGYDNNKPTLSVGSAATLAGGQYIYLDTNAIKKNKTATFTARITSFSSIRMGHGEAIYGASYFDIDNTNINIYNYTTSESLSHSWAHGLTISDFITVFASVDETGVITIRIQTNGEEYECVSGWNGYNGRIFVKSVGSILTDCVFTWDCADYQKPIYAFGDSYFNFSETSRWPYYIRTYGYDNWLLNGFPGQDSASAFGMLLNVLNHHKPKYLLWALGMNNADTTVVNATWKSNFDTIKMICATYDIELIACTIPNVPSRVHTYKNAIVRSSGLRYIDFEKAVGADLSANWYTGMLSGDLVHPDVKGAKALAYRALLDFPELARK